MSKDMPEGSELKQPHASGPLSTGLSMHHGVQYKMYKLKGTITSNCSGSNCFELGGRVAIVRNIVHSTARTHVGFELFETGACFFNYPIDSTCLGVCLLSKLSGQLASAPVTDFTKPLLLLPLRKMLVALPQLHRTWHDGFCRMPSFSVVEFVDEIDPDGCKKVEISIQWISVFTHVIVVGVLLFGWIPATTLSLCRLDICFILCILYVYVFFSINTGFRAAK